MPSNHPTILSSVVLFSSCLQSFLASGSFPVSQFFPSGGQSIGASTSASVPPTNIQDWFPLGLTGLISLQSKGLSGVFSSTTVWMHQFFGAQFSVWSNFHIHTLTAEKAIPLTGHPLSVKSCLCFLICCLGLSQLFFQASFNFMASVSICSAFGVQENKVCHCFHCFSIYLPWSDGTGCHDLSFLNVEF